VTVTVNVWVSGVLSVHTSITVRVPAGIPVKVIGVIELSVVTVCLVSGTPPTSIVRTLDDSWQPLQLHVIVPVPPVQLKLRPPLGPTPVQYVSYSAFFHQNVASISGYVVALKSFGLIGHALGLQVSPGQQLPGLM
jgi:hypothetical protein